MNDNLELLFRHYELLAEYTSKTIPNSKNSVLSFGLSVLAALLTGSLYLLSTGKYLDVSLVSFLVLIPAASATVMFIWLGEVDRMMRAGTFLLDLEHRINKMAGERLLFFEAYIREPKRRIRYPDVCAMGVFLGTILLSSLTPLLVPGTAAKGLTAGGIIAYTVAIEAIVLAIAVRVAAKVNRGLKLTRGEDDACD